MKIAILGWGSLLWQPKDLQFDKEIGWSENGPMLPIEFARISKDERLTLVITEDAKEVKTYFAISSYESEEEAVLNLAIREGCGRGQIGSYDKSKNTFEPNVFFEKNILEWIKNKDIDAVIWTNLGEKWDVTNNDGEVIKIVDRVDYLKKLKNHKRALAEEYIRRTPTQIDTHYRSLIEKELDWKPIL